MALGQKFQDFQMLFKESRKVQILTGIGVLMALSLFMGGKPHQGRRRPPEKKQETLMSEGYEENFKDLIVTMRSDLDDINLTLVQHGSEMKQTKEDLKTMEQKTAKILTKVLEKMTEIQSTVHTGGPGGGASSVISVAGGEIDSGLAGGGDYMAPEDSLEGFGDATDDLEVMPPPDAGQVKIATIGIGDSVRVKLLAGVNAPTDGTPYPTLFKLTGEVQGPDGTSLPLGEARLLAAAQGSLTDSRALFRLSSLNVKFPNGSRSVYSVDGWLVGEDGIRGLKGIMVDPLGKVLAGTAAAGFVEGVGEGMKTGGGYQVITDSGSYDAVQDGELYEYAIGEGLGKAGQQWTKYIEQRMDLMVPHVKVYSGREATAVFSKNLSIEGLYEQYQDENAVYGSLD